MNTNLYIAKEDGPLFGKLREQLGRERRSLSRFVADSARDYLVYLAQEDRESTRRVEDLETWYRARRMQLLKAGAAGADMTG